MTYSTARIFLIKLPMILPHRFISLFLSFSLILSPVIGYAQIPLPSPGTAVTLSTSFRPTLLAAMTIYPDNPLKFDFIVSDGEDIQDQAASQKEAQRLVEYFLSGLTIPEKDLWVNLSPYEKDRVVPEEVGKTELGHELLALDYLLKQLTASLTHPENETGKVFWEKVYARAQAEYGTIDIPTDLFNRVWIMPDKAVVYQKGNTIFVGEAKLKVLLDEDLLAQGFNKTEDRFGNFIPGARGQQITSQFMREVLIPVLEKEVNEGKHFARLRQIYQSVILSKWFKETLKESLLGRIYVDQKKIQGIDDVQSSENEEIYNQYVQAYREGVVSFIEEYYDEGTQQVVPRRYFSGGMALVDPKVARAGISESARRSLANQYGRFPTRLLTMSVDQSAAMLGNEVASRDLEAVVAQRKLMFALSTAGGWSLNSLTDRVQNIQTIAGAGNTPQDSTNAAMLPEPEMKRRTFFGAVASLTAFLAWGCGREDDLLYPAEEQSVLFTYDHPERIIVNNVQARIVGTRPDSQEPTIITEFQSDFKFMQFDNDQYIGLKTINAQPFERSGIVELEISEKLLQFGGRQLLNEEITDDILAQNLVVVAPFYDREDQYTPPHIAAQLRRLHNGKIGIALPLALIKQVQPNFKLVFTGMRLISNQIGLPSGQWRGSSSSFFSIYRLPAAQSRFGIDENKQNVTILALSQDSFINGDLKLRIVSSRVTRTLDSGEEISVYSGEQKFLFYEIPNVEIPPQLGLPPREIIYNYDRPVNSSLARVKNGIRNRRMMAAIERRGRAQRRHQGQNKDASNAAMLGATKGGILLDGNGIHVEFQSDQNIKPIRFLQFPPLNIQIPGLQINVLSYRPINFQSLLTTP